MQAIDSKYQPATQQTVSEKTNLLLSPAAQHFFAIFAGFRDLAYQEPASF
jgi:hypothetical protein